MNCIYLKQKIDRTIYCKKNNKIININECSCCSFRTFKEVKKSNSSFKPKKSLIEKQNKRFSIINHSLLICAECGSKNGVAKNEVFEGAKRGVSMSNGFVVPLCRDCHRRFHNDRNFAMKYKKLYQSKFEETHTREEFLNLVHHNYL